jgi:hypothetical protein
MGGNGIEAGGGSVLKVILYGILVFCLLSSVLHPFAHLSLA